MTSREPVQSIVDAEAVGRFGFHPNPTIDFCVEVKSLVALAGELDHGTSPATKAEIVERITKAMEFCVGGDLWAIGAKDRLRELEREMSR